MYDLHAMLVRPLLQSVGANRMLEVGSDQAGHTRLLAEYAREVGGHVDVIEPTVSDNLASVREDFRDVVTVHVGKSLEVLPQVEVPDVVLIDGDHNHYTVHDELITLQRSVAASGRSFPLVLLHDVGWPYGRRDMYYDPADVPDERRHPHARRGIRFGVAELAPEGGGGFNEGFENAITEGGEANGVLTAAEDFVDTDPRLVLYRFHGMHGLAVVAQRQDVDTNAELRRLLSLSVDPTVEALTRAVEEARCLLLQQLMDQAWRAAQAEAMVTRLREELQEARAVTTDADAPSAEPMP